MLNQQELIKTSAEIRKIILQKIYLAGSSHIGSCFSAVEILAALYFYALNINPGKPNSPDRDIFIMSKGHAAVALYATLARRGFFDVSLLDDYGKNGSKIAGHVIAKSLPGIEATAGSLGHGLPIISGMSLAAKINKENNRKYYCLLGDGECNEGVVWEAAMFASQHKLNNLVAIIDFNKQQGLGDSSAIINLNNMAERWSAFGWEVLEVDGHDFKDLARALDYFKNKTNDRPALIIARTVKGKGVSWMENNVAWHYKSPDEEQYKKALAELSLLD